MLLSLPLALSLTACAGTSAAVRCDEPELRGETWGDVAIYAVEARAALRVCNARNGHE